MKPLLIIISGPPCSGKTTLGKWLAQELRLPYIYKDGIKETLFDSLGWSDRAWSKKLGGPTYDLMFYFIEAQLAAGVSHIVEANFYAEFHTPKFLALKGKYEYRPFQIQCYADGEVLFDRFKRRATSGSRHPGHVESLNLDEFKPGLLIGKAEILDIGGGLLEIDTTDFSKLDYQVIVKSIRVEQEVST